MITGEGVVVAVPVAGPAIRLLSGLIDAAVTLVVALLLAWFTSWILSLLDVHLDDALAAAWGTALGVLVLLGVPVVGETLGRGRTPGKLVTGLRTVRDDGAPVDLRRTLTRHLVGVVEVWGLMGSAAVISLLLTRPTRRLGDMAAGTYVARDRVRLALPAAAEMPPTLADWAARADIHVPDDLAMLVRVSLVQRAQFSATTADRTAHDLAGRLLPCVRPAPPEDTPPAAVVDAIMAERRRRETARLLRRQQRRDRLFPR
ncbi:hypothetical protein MOPEL_099_00190 [Mobilicoccus pelagius NBRC 104925]|uniref:RDD domain-containing protein n=2 Tax=Mobilicoccus TaxID=984996 RepID=H5UU11_9MICO|nr:hypothetical protein MOPEL_099_00190 [Mobilicoccus pelagius NBRC 104925]